MTIPIIRKRAKKPKVRTGCRTCRQRHIKCDEERPGCNRCRIAGRECGYDFVPATEKKGEVVLLPKGQGVVRGPRVLGTDLTEHEGLAFDYFRLETVRQLPGSSWTLSWERLALQMGLWAPAVTHAAVALGSIHRAFKTEGYDGRQHEFALSQYSKAMGSVQRHIEKLEEGCPDEDVEVVLLVSLLFFCFEVLHSEDVRATMHLKTGLRILYERVKRRYQTGDGSKRREVITPTTPKSNMDVLVQTFVRLDGDLTIVGEDEPYLSPVCIERLPTSFSSLEQAMVHLDAIGSRTHDVCRDIVLLADKKVVMKRSDYAFLDDDFKSCLACAYSRTIDIDDRPDLIKRMEEIKRDLSTWMTALANVSTTTQQRSAQILTQIHFFYVWFVVSTWRDQDEVAVDRLDAQFDHMLTQAEQYVDLHWNATAPDQERASIRTQNARTRQAFTLGTDLVPCIAMIAFKSRTSSIRRRSVELLRSINLQGVFDNYFLASFMDEIWQTEEQLARAMTGKPAGEDFRCDEIPAEARMVEIELSPMQYKHDFYKADVGRIVYAALDGSGEMQAYERLFEVERPEELGSGRRFSKRSGLDGWVAPGVNRTASKTPWRGQIRSLDSTPSPGPSKSTFDTLSTASNNYEDGIRSVRRVRGHMPCCCHHPHGVDDSPDELPLDNNASIQPPRQPIGFFASFWGWQQSESIQNKATEPVDTMWTEMSNAVAGVDRLEVAD